MCGAYECVSICNMNVWESLSGLQRQQRRQPLGHSQLRIPTHPGKEILTYTKRPDFNSMTLGEAQRWEVAHSHCSALV